MEAIHKQVKLSVKDASHELRISMTGLLGASFMLKQTTLTETQSHAVELLMTSFSRLSELADKLS